MLIKYNFQISYMKGLENKKINVLNRKSKYPKKTKNIYPI